MIGGGPAGATVARRLAQLGHDVCLAEREAFPRPHVGESLAPGILPLLDFLELRGPVERAGFLRPQTSIVGWGGAEPRETHWPVEPGFQVDRGRFDQILLRLAVDAGVRVFQPAQAQRPVRRPDGSWHIRLRTPESAFGVEARLVIDATGRRSVVGGTRQRDAAATLALYAYWQETAVQSTATRIEAGDSEWYWGAPLPDGTFNATVFIEPRRCAAAGRDGLAELYGRLLARSVLLRECLNGRRLTAVLACDATSRHACQPAGGNFLKVGEASFSVDPLSSQGVQMAMTSALQASIAAHTLLAREENAELAITFCRERQAETVQRCQIQARQFYGEQAALSPVPFWRRRAGNGKGAPNRPALRKGSPSLGCRLRLAPDAKMIEVPILRDDFVERARGLTHASLDRPIAFLENVAIGRVLDVFKTPATPEEALRELAASSPAEGAWRVLSWLWARGILVEPAA